MTSLFDNTAAMTGLGSVTPLWVQHAPGASAASIIVFLAGALWTAVELPAAPARVPLRRLTAVTVCLVIILALLVFLAALFAGLVPGLRTMSGRFVASESLGLAAAGAIAGAAGFYLLVRLGLFKRAILVLGGAPDWAEAGAALDPGRGPLFRIADVMSADRFGRAALGALQRHKIWAVVLAGATCSVDTELKQCCRGLGVRVLTEEEFRERWLGRVDLDRPHSAAITALAAGGKYAAAVRRGADIVLAITLLLFTLPLTLVAALLIKLDSRGPIFYRQERVGLNRQPFQLVKFRSMRADAEAGLDPQWARPADPRVTRIGGFLRLTRIDELPQLWNVLRGEMSVIGPRPERPFFVERLAACIPRYHDRAQVKPGITGWAQVNYRYGASIEDAQVKLAYDLYYVKHRSLLLDLSILAATVRVVLFQEGAR